jgi:mycofactocin precursor
MPDSTASVESAAADVPTPTLADEDLILEEDLLVEDVSIDGMCGVY